MVVGTGSDLGRSESRSPNLSIDLGLKVKRISLLFISHWQAFRQKSRIQRVVGNGEPKGRRRSTWNCPYKLWQSILIPSWSI